MSRSTIKTTEPKTLYRALKVRVYPTPAQEASLRLMAGHCRFVWNHLLGLNQARLASEIAKRYSRNDMTSILTQLKKEEQTAWLSELPSKVAGIVCSNLENAYKAAFSKTNPARKPVFKNKKTAKLSVTFPQDHGSVRAIFGDNGHGTLKVQKISDMKFRSGWDSKTKSKLKDWPITAELREITISQDKVGKWYASILYKKTVDAPKERPVTEETTVGIDVGVKQFATLSSGQVIQKPKFVEADAQRIDRLNQLLSLKMNANKDFKRSNRYARLLKKRNILWKKTTCRRGDWVDKVIYDLVGDSQVNAYVIEDLAVSDMLQQLSADGNHSLANQAQSACWSLFRSKLAVKLEDEGKQLLVINQYEPSSKTCSSCGHVEPSVKLGVSEWTCVACNTVHDRDFNASKNIKMMWFAGSREGAKLPQDVYKNNLRSGRPSPVGESLERTDRGANGRSPMQTCLSKSLGGHSTSGEPYLDCQRLAFFS